MEQPQKRHPAPPAVFEGSCATFLFQTGDSCSCSMLEFDLNAIQVTMVAALRPTSLPINKAIFAHDALQIASWKTWGKRSKYLSVGTAKNTVNHYN